MVDTINIKELNLAELNGVVNIYPWYAAARKELCRRMAELGEGSWSDERYADAALYIGSRKIVGDLVRKSQESDYSDKDIKSLLETYFPKEETSAPVREERKVFVVGGDYFSQSEYEGVRRSDDNIFSSFATKAKAEGYVETPAADLTDFCTETLAEIYVEQEYYQQAIEIYNKLSLRYPEKSVYFADQIEKIKNR